MHRVRPFFVMALLVVAPWSGAAIAADAPAVEPASRPMGDLHLSLSEAPGETTVRLPLRSEGSPLYGLLSPYLSLGSITTLDVPWSATLAPGLRRRDPDGLDDLRLGAGIALPLSQRAQLYGEYRFLRGRIDGTLLHREPDAADFRAGFSIRLN